MSHVPQLCSRASRGQRTTSPHSSHLKHRSINVGLRFEIPVGWRRVARWRVVPSLRKGSAIDIAPPTSPITQSLQPQANTAFRFQRHNPFLLHLLTRIHHRHLETSYKRGQQTSQLSSSKALSDTRSGSVIERQKGIVARRSTRVIRSLYTATGRIDPTLRHKLVSIITPELRTPVHGSWTDRETRACRNLIPKETHWFWIRS